MHILREKVASTSTRGRLKESDDDDENAIKNKFQLYCRPWCVCVCVCDLFSDNNALRFQD